MRDYFYRLADGVLGSLQGGEFVYLNLSGEESDFVRLNHSKIRQNGHVSQYYMAITLISTQKQLKRCLTLSLNEERDLRMIGDSIENMRSSVSQIDNDPYILFAQSVNSTELCEPSRLPRAGEIVEQIIESAAGLDLVGILCIGEIMAGFANSAGQRNWFEKSSFNLDWSIYHAADKAVKAGYSGYTWDSDQFSSTMSRVKNELEIMKRDPITVPVDSYRVYLAPAALESIMQLLGWGGFGIKSQRTKNSALLKLVEKEVRLDPSISIVDNRQDGSSPNFDAAGFIKSELVTLIKNGEYSGSLISPRSAKEFGVEQNGASSFEEPESLEMQGGCISSAAILKELGTGIYLNHLHYLNYSEKTSCRITGMSRFAAFYVREGEIVAPINVMRFDESLFRMLGSKFRGATVERERIMSSNTYESRQTYTSLLPGIIVDDFSFKA